MNKVKRGKYMRKRGISLIVLIVTIIVIIILAAVVILTLSKNNPIESAKKATYMQDVNNIQDSINMLFSKKRESEYLSGKLSDFEIDEKLIQKYNDVLYVKNNKVCLDYIATIENGKVYKSYSKMVDNLKDNLEICYDGLKACNKVTNFSFDDGLNGWGQRTQAGNTTEIKNENGNNYLYIELHVSSGNTQYVYQEPTVTSEYNSKIYFFAKYRNRYVQNEENYKINTPITLSRGGMGYDQNVLLKQNYLSAYNKGWQSISCMRSVLEPHGNKRVHVHFGGGAGNLTTYEYTIDIDDVYMINLTEIFGAGNEPSKAEMDAIFEKFV